MAPSLGLHFALPILHPSITQTLQIVRVKHVVQLCGLIKLIYQLGLMWQVLGCFISWVDEDDI